MIQSAVLALAFFASLAVHADNKSPDVAAKLSDKFKLGEVTPVYFYSPSDNFLNFAGMCVDANCKPTDGSVGKSVAITKSEKSKYHWVATSTRLHKLEKGSLVTLLYTVAQKSTVYKRVYELNAANVAVSPSGFELTLKEEAVVGEMSARPAQTISYGQNAYQASGGSLQDIAQARANALAANNVLTHDIAGAPGKPSNVFEGVGYGVGVAPTCVGPGRVVADASALSASGLIFRVRFYQ